MSKGLFVVAVACTLAFTVLSHTSAERAPAAPVAGAPTPDTPRAPNTEPAAAPSGGGRSPTQVDIDPDRFYRPTRLAPHERPPQFVIVSFDGAGNEEKWAYWRSVAGSSRMRFTGFLSGVYLLDSEHSAEYRGPGHRPGATALGYWPTAGQVRQLVWDLNTAWSSGNEIGTHYVGHFCSDAPPGGQQWSTSDWSSELDQFFRFWRDAPGLQVPADSVVGGRTPCLEGRPAALMPALAAHRFQYDTSGVRPGIGWPTRNRYGIWEFPLPFVPLAGTGAGVVAMDYNFWVKQTGNPPSTQDSVGDAQQVLQTYRQMYQAAYRGNRAPLVLGNHFNSWNGNAYTVALAEFVRETCRNPDTLCVPYRDVIRWMQLQDPAALARLQALPPVDVP